MLTTDYPPIEGGISTVAREAARELEHLGHAVTVIAPFFPGMDDFDKMEPATIVRYRGYRLGWLRAVPMLFAARERMHWADAVLAMNIGQGGLVAWLLKGFAHRPYLVVAYAYEFLRFKTVPIFSGLLCDAFNDAQAVIAISQFTRRGLKEFGVDEERIRTILPGAPETFPFDQPVLDALRERHVLNDKRVILAVGRFIKRKNHIRLVEALPKILERYPDTALVMIGQGPELPNVTRKAIELGVRANIRLPGRLSDHDVAKFYALCDVFALPTGVDPGGHVEGFGLVFAEAQAYGKPVVAGRSGGTEDAVLASETGLLVDPDDPGKLADAIISLFDDPERAARLGAAGKARVESELNWRVFAQSLAEAMKP